MGLPKLTTTRANEKLNDRPIKCLGLINGYITRSRWRCLICLYKWESTPHVVLTHKHGCPKCKKYSNEKLDKQLEGRNIRRCENVTKARKKIKFLCTKCENEWYTT